MSFDDFDDANSLLPVVAHELLPVRTRAEVRPDPSVYHLPEPALHSSAAIRLSLEPAASSSTMGDASGGAIAPQESVRGVVNAHGMSDEGDGEASEDAVCELGGASFVSLWDQVPLVVQRVEVGIESTRFLARFTEKLAEIEASFAAAIAKLVDGARTHLARVKESVVGRSSLVVAWDQMLHVVACSGKQHGLLASQLVDDAVRVCDDTAVELAKKHKDTLRLMEDSLKSSRKLEVEVASAERTFRAIVRKAKAYERAAGLDATPHGDADAGSGEPSDAVPADVRARVQTSERAYADALRRARDSEIGYVTTSLPTMLTRWENIDLLRTSATKRVCVSLVSALKLCPEAIADELATLACRVAVIDPEADVDLFCAEHASGQPLPSVVGDAQAAE